MDSSRSLSRRREEIGEALLAYQKHLSEKQTQKGRNKENRQPKQTNGRSELAKENARLAKICAELKKQVQQLMAQLQQQRTKSSGLYTALQQLRLINHSLLAQRSKVENDRQLVEATTLALNRRVIQLLEYEDRLSRSRRPVVQAPVLQSRLFVVDQFDGVIDSLRELEQDLRECSSGLRIRYETCLAELQRAGEGRTRPQLSRLQSDIHRLQIQLQR